MPQKEKRSFLDKFTGARSVDQPQDMQTMPVYADETATQETQMQMRQEPAAPMQQPAPQQQQQEEQQWEEEQVDEEGQLTIDVYQTENDIVIKSTIAGVKPEDLDVAINNDMVTIKGDRKTEETVEDENYYYQECYWGSFSRSVVLPVDIISDKADAALKNGILTIRLPKADTTKTKKIQVRGF